jgi:hypothetical protein
VECALSVATAIPGDIIRVIRAAFDKIFNNVTEYRATRVILTKLSEDQINQLDLF